MKEPLPPEAVPPAAGSWTALSDGELRASLELLLAQVGFRRLQRVGFHLQRNDFYSPLNDCDFLEANPDLWNDPPLDPPGIDWRPEAQMETARVVGSFAGELADVPAEGPADGSCFGWKNNFWENADAVVHYGIVRSCKPARYVEIGCGWSSLLLARALGRNAQEGRGCEVDLVEPYPNPRIFAHLPAAWRHHRSIVQRVDLALFDRLEAGDVLFYDGSHCAKVGSDVNWFFFRILPRLKPGVIIHLHDISLPHEYPPPWIFERGQTWNEQYVLHAFLMHNTAYRILIANRHLYLHRARELEELYGRRRPVWGSSVWLGKVGS